MTTLHLGPRPEDFIWASGIEDTFVPQTRPGHRALDEYELMGHYEHWREDLALVRDLGMQAVRWGVPWYRVEPLPGEFDWRWTDEVLPTLVQEYGITPIVDLMHYGCPFWLRREFASADYPQRVAAYAEAFARRYAGLVHWYTPLNEPLINAHMCGRVGAWPPYLREDSGYVLLVMQLTKGILQTVAAIRAADPAAIMVHVDAAGLSHAARPDLEPLALEDQHQRYLVYDLLTGRVTPEHPLWAWLLRHGAPPDDLARIAATPITLDVLGLNFYPQWSSREVYVNKEGQAAYRITERRGLGFAQMVAEYYARYNAPILITETSARGNPGVRARWLATAMAATKALRARGVPVVGHTWFPLFTMIDWRYRHGRGAVGRYRIELGLYKLGPPGGPRWLPTPLVAQMLAYMRDPATSIGPLLTAESADAPPSAPSGADSRPPGRGNGGHRSRA